VAPPAAGSQGLPWGVPRRWDVERTFAWLSQSRRLSKDPGRLYETSEAWIYGAMSRLRDRRLATP
jgi:transposase